MIIVLITVVKYPDIHPDIHKKNMVNQTFKLAEYDSRKTRRIRATPSNTAG